MVGWSPLTREVPWISWETEEPVASGVSSLSHLLCES